jgi:hypothetical protein
MGKYRKLDRNDRLGKIEHLSVGIFLGHSGINIKVRASIIGEYHFWVPQTEFVAFFIITIKHISIDG